MPNRPKINQKCVYLFIGARCFWVLGPIFNSELQYTSRMFNFWRAKICQKTAVKNFTRIFSVLLSKSIRTFVHCFLGKKLVYKQCTGIKNIPQITSVQIVYKTYEFSVNVVYKINSYKWTSAIKPVYFDVR